MSSEENAAGERLPEEILDSGVSSEIPPEEKLLLAGMKPRIVRSTLILGVAGSILFGLWRGSGWAGGFAIGAALSALSFRWMHSAIDALAEMTVSQASTNGRGTAGDISPGQIDGEATTPQKHSSSGAVRRSMLRYALIALAGYAIFRSSVLSLPAFFAGLFVAIAAVLAEIAYQLGRSFRSPGIYG